MKTVLSAFLILASLLSTTAMALESSGPPACKDDQILIASGDEKSTYTKIVKDIIAFCPMVCEYQQTRGGADNIDLLLKKTVEAGMVPIDVAEYMKRGDERVGKLRSLVSLNGQAMHIIVAANGVAPPKGKSGIFNLGKSPDKNGSIKTLNDLKGRKVAAWSSGVVSARMVDERLKLGLDIVEVENREEGLAAVKDGSVAALIVMGANPMEWIETLDRNIYSLADVDPSDITKLGSPYYQSKMTYKKLGLISGINVITTKNEIFVRDIGGEQGQQLIALRNCIQDNLKEIGDRRGSHASWIDVIQVKDTTWTRYEGKESAKTLQTSEPEPTVKPETATKATRKKATVRS